MSTLDAIEYDQTKLAALTQAQLLMQICYRLDTRTPKREPQVNAKKYALAITQAIENVIDNLPKELKPLQDKVRAQLLEMQEATA